MIQLYYNNKKTFLFFLLSLGACLISGYIIYSQLFYNEYYYLSTGKRFYEYVPFTFKSLTKINYIFVLGIIFFLVGCIVLLKELFKKNPAVIIDEKGIFTRWDGLIPWDEIKSISTLSMDKQNFVGITLKNPENYINSFGLLKRTMIRLNSSYGSHIYLHNLVIKPVDINKINQFQSKMLLESKIRH